MTDDELIEQLRSFKDDEDLFYGSHIADQAASRLTELKAAISTSDDNIARISASIAAQETHPPGGSRELVSARTIWKILAAVSALSNPSGEVRA